MSVTEIHERDIPPQVVYFESPWWSYIDGRAETLQTLLVFGQRVPVNECKLEPEDQFIGVHLYARRLQSPASRPRWTHRCGILADNKLTERITSVNLAAVLPLHRYAKVFSAPEELKLSAAIKYIFNRAAPINGTASSRPEWPDGRSAAAPPKVILQLDSLDQSVEKQLATSVTPYGIISQIKKVAEPGTLWLAK